MSHLLNRAIRLDGGVEQTTSLSDLSRQHSLALVHGEEKRRMAALWNIDPVPGAHVASDVHWARRPRTKCTRLGTCSSLMHVASLWHQCVPCFEKCCASPVTSNAAAAAAAAAAAVPLCCSSLLRLPTALSLLGPSRLHPPLGAWYRRCRQGASRHDISKEVSPGHSPPHRSAQCQSWSAVQQHSGRGAW